MGSGAKNRFKTFSGVDIDLQLGVYGFFLYKPDIRVGRDGVDFQRNLQRIIARGNGGGLRQHVIIKRLRSTLAAGSVKFGICGKLVRRVCACRQVFKDTVD